MKKILFIGLAVFIVLICMVFVYLNYVYIPKQLKPMVIKLLEENLKKNVNIAKASYFPVKRVLFADVEILNQDQSLFLNVDSIGFGLKSIPSINKDAFSAKLGLGIKGLRFKQQDIEVSGGCKVDLDINIKAKAVEFSAIVDLKDIKVLGIKETGEITKIKGRLLCSQSSFESENISADIGGQILNIIIQGDLDNKNIIVKKLDINYQKTNLSIKGKVSNIENPNIDFTLQGLVKLEDIKAIVSGIPLPAISGDCDINAKCMGVPTALDKLSADATLLLSNAEVEKIKVEKLKADIKLENGDLNLASLDCDFYKGKITGQAKVKIVDQSIPLEGSIDAQNLDIEPLVKDIIGQNMGQGILNAHFGVSGSVSDLNTLKGNGWFKVIQGKVKMPPNFSKVANTLGVTGLSEMNIEEVSATFSLSDGKLETKDLIMIAAEATISGVGYIDLEQYVDFEAMIKLSKEFVQNSGGAAQLLNFASDETGAPLAKIKIYDKLAQLKYKIVPLPVKNIIENKIKDELKNIFNKKDDGVEGQEGKDEIQDQIKEGLKKIFR